MSIFIDTLAQIISQSTDDADATREDWQQALDQALPKADRTLDPRERQAHSTEYDLTWEIQADGKSPVEAAISAWQQTFRRGGLQPSTEEACVFDVTDRSTGDTVQIDLSDERFAIFFENPVPQGFWPQIDHQLERIIREKPSSFDAVRKILLDPVYDDITRNVSLNGVRAFDEDSAFFDGSGGDATLLRALLFAGWVVIDQRAGYHYVVRHSLVRGEELTYTEGDVQRGNLIT